MKRPLASLSSVVAERALRSVPIVAIAWLLLHLPSVAQACSVCTAGRDEENQTAFLLSTIFMSLLPLVAIGTLVYVLWRRIQKLEAAAAVQEAPIEG